MTASAMRWTSERRELVARLMLEPPAIVPPEVHADIARDNAATARRRARAFAFAFGGGFAFVPLLLWVGVREWFPFVIAYAAFGAAFVVTRSTMRAAAPSASHVWLQALLVAFFVVMLSRLTGAWLIGPPIGALALGIFATHPLLRRMTALFGVFTAAVFAPIVLERVGVLSRTYEFGGNGIHIISHGLEMRPIASELTLALFELLLLTIAVVIARAIARGMRDSQERLAMQAWHLRQLLPET